MLQKENSDRIGDNGPSDGDKHQKNPKIALHGRSERIFNRYIGEHRSRAHHHQSWEEERAEDGREGAANAEDEPDIRDCQGNGERRNARECHQENLLVYEARFSEDFWQRKHHFQVALADHVKDDKVCNG